MKMDRGQNCCKCCFSFTTTLGLTALFLWLSLRTSEPKCYIGAFQVPALNKTSQSTSNSTVVFMVEFDNENKDKGIRYDDVNVTFRVFLDRNKTRPIGSYTIPGFYQGHQKKAKKWGSIDARGGALNLTAVDNKTYFRVDFTTAAKYKILLWFTKRDRLWGGANVEMADSGLKAHKKGIRLGNSPPVIVSGAPKLDGCYCALLVLGLFVNFSLLGLLI